MREIRFSVWFTEKWLETGGLISQATAAKMLNKTQGRVSQMVKEKKLKLFQYDNMSYVSFIEVRKIAQEQNHKKAIKIMEEASALLPVSEAANFEEIQKAILDFAMNPPETYMEEDEEE